MAKKILVTGGTGFLGSALVKALVSEGCAIRVLDNNFRGTLRRLKEIKNDFKFIKADVRSQRVVRKAVKGVDAVVHLAFINGTEFFYSIPEEVLDVGIKGTINVIDACLKENVGEVFFASSSEVYQTPSVIPTPEDVRMTILDPLNPRYSYAGGKIIGELMFINYGRKYFDRVSIFRPHNVYGPDMGWEHVIPEFVLRMKNLNEKTKKGKTIRFPIQGSGKETRSFCYIDDFTNGLMRVIKKGKHLEIYNIGTDQETSIKKLAKEIGKYFDRKIEIVPGKLKRGGTPRRCPDITKIKKLGYKPKTPLSEGLKNAADWYVENAHLKPNKKIVQYSYV